jgi:endoribonuclease Dicer
MDSDDEYDLPQTATTQGQRRRVQEAIFESWLVSPETQEALKPKAKFARLIDAVDEELSIQSLMAKHGTKIVTHPREYQLELFELAKKQNTIAVLDTGSGKTLIAVLLVRWTIDEELERRAAGKPAKTSFFLTQSVALAYQQFSVLEMNLDHKVKQFSSLA